MVRWLRIGGGMSLAALLLAALPAVAAGDPDEPVLRVVMAVLGLATTVRRQELGVLIEHIFAQHDGTYGYRRIHAALARMGRPCDPETARAIMRERGLVACQPRAARRCTTRRAAEVADIPDLVGRDFTSDTPGASSSAT